MLRSVTRTFATISLSVLAAAPAHAATTLRAAGSTTVAPLLARWSAMLAAGPLPVTIKVEAKGSSMASPALLAGSAELGAMSRGMDDAELAEWQRIKHYAPTPVHVALDAVAVLVHPGNPLQRINFTDLRRIYTGAAKTWGDLGVADPAWASRRIVRYQRDENSGTRELFDRVALEGMAIAPGAHTVETFEAMVAAVAADPGGIGYGSVGEGAKRVHDLELSAGPGKPYFAPTYENVSELRYPLLRFLYLYLDVPPGKAVAPPIAALIRLICSPQGQRVVTESGFLTLPLDYCRKDLMHLLPADG